MQIQKSCSENCISVKLENVLKWSTDSDTNLTVGADRRR